MLVGLLLLLMAAGVSAQVVGGGILGDVDGDGDLDYPDVLQLIDYVVNPTGFPANADANNDGRLDVLDINYVLERFGWVAGPSPTPPSGEAVDLYGVFEKEVLNTDPGICDPELATSCINPYDYDQIVLATTFTHRDSGQVKQFWGFHDADGVRDDTAENRLGDVWKFRFMPDQTGVWDYTWEWVYYRDEPPGGYPGGSGSFTVVDTGLPGPLRVDPDNPRFFETARGDAFDFRAYGLLDYQNNYGSDFLAGYSEDLGETGNFLRWQLDNVMIPGGYNFSLLPGHGGPIPNPSGTGDTPFRRYYPSGWYRYEEALQTMVREGIYVIEFRLSNQDGIRTYPVDDFANMMKYRLARFGSYYSLMGYSPTWEWDEVVDSARINELMGTIGPLSIYDLLLSAHDTSEAAFVGWMDFSMRQSATNHDWGDPFFDTGDRTRGRASPGNHPAIDPPFDELPIVGAEDVWVDPLGGFGQPRTVEEVRKVMWASMMVGVMPLYTEWSWTSAESQGDNPAIDVATMRTQAQLMWDFFYGQTRYREYRELTGLLTSNVRRRQLASGLEGEEYLVFDDNGQIDDIGANDGGIVSLDLTGVVGNFSVTWFNPQTGAEQGGGTVAGGGVRDLTPPGGLFAEVDDDTVVWLRR